MKQAIRNQIDARLRKAVTLMDEAVLLAKTNGWPDAIGFASGDSVLNLNVIRSMEIREAQNGSPPKEDCICPDHGAFEWDCGAW